MNSKEIARVVEQAVVSTAAMLGIGETEMSYTRASQKYGQFFRDMVRSRRLRPCRVGNGKNGTHWFAVKDILALKNEEEDKASLIL